MASTTLRSRNYYTNIIHGKEKITTYRSSSDVCAHCGNRGGDHYTYDGISWCYPGQTRAECGSKKYHTYFTYKKKDLNNPNETFIRKY